MVDGSPNNSEKKEKKGYDKSTLVKAVIIAFILGSAASYLITSHFESKYQVTDYFNLEEGGVKYKRLEYPLIGLAREDNNRIVPVINFPYKQVAAGETFMKKDDKPFVEGKAKKNPTNVILLTPREREAKKTASGS